MSDTIFTSRREFISGGLTFLSAAATLPAFLGQTASALAQQAQPGKKKNSSNRILVVVQLAGGNDGLNTVIPYSQDAYYNARPQLGIRPDKLLKLDQNVGLHSGAKGLKELFDAGKLAIVQGVGYPNPNRSHFTSMDIWHTADPNARKNSGWLGRYFDATCNGSDPDPEPINGIALMKELPVAMQGDRFTALAFDNPDSLTWRPGKQDKQADEAFRKLNNISGDLPHDGPALAQYLQRAALKAQLGAAEIRSATGEKVGAKRQGLFERGGDLGRNLQMVAKMIASDLPTRIYYVSMGGFDTHTGQQGRHERLMQEFGNSMKTFIDELEEHKLLDRVLVLTFSEFGRRVQENASGGTDHGEAAPLFLFGAKVRPGLHEQHPDLSNLHRGDLQFGCDFRRVYASVLQNWMGAHADQVLGPGFGPLPVLRA